MQHRGIIVALFIALLLAACGGTEPSQEADAQGEQTGQEAGGEGEQAVVNYLMGAPENPADAEVAEQIAVMFEEEHPNIDVEIEMIPTEEQRTIIQTQLQSGAGPDVFGYDTGPGFGGVLAKAGLLYDLGPAYEEYGWDIYEWAKPRVTYDGVLSGIPLQVEQIGLFYNQDLFEQLGLEEPETLDDLRAVADAALAEDLIPFAFGNQEQWPAGHQFSMTASNVLGKEGLDDILYGDGTWNQPDAVRAIEIFFEDFRDAGYLPESVNAITYDDANSLFYSQQALMIPTGTWLISDIDATVQDFEVGYMPFPAIDGGEVYPPSGLGAGWFVSANADDPQAAIEYLDFMLSDEIARMEVEQLKTVPAHPVDLEGLDISPLFSEVLGDLEQLSAGSGESFGYNIDVLTPQQFNDVMFTGFQEVLNGTRTAQEQADALQEAWAAAKEAGTILDEP